MSLKRRNTQFGLLVPLLKGATPDSNNNKSNDIASLLIVPNNDSLNKLKKRS